MKKILFLSTISVALLASCQKKETSVEFNRPENRIIGNHNQKLKDFCLELGNKDSYLIEKIGKDIVEKDFNSDSITNEIEKAKKYYDDLSIGYYSISQQSIYSLDSIIIKNDYKDKRKFEVENIKSKLIIMQTQITRFRIESVFVTGKYLNLLAIRKDCLNKVSKKELASCRERFDNEVNEVNTHIDKLNAIEKEIESYK